MRQITVAETKIVKEGTRVEKKSGKEIPWKLVSVTTDTGEKLSGFFPNLASLMKGQVIEVETEQVGEYTNIKDWHKVEGKTTESTQVKPAITTTGKEAIEEKKPLYVPRGGNDSPETRASIETQCIFKGLVDLAIAGKSVTDLPPGVQRWVLAHFPPLTPGEAIKEMNKPTETSKEPVKETKAGDTKTKKPRDPKTITSIEKLAQALKDDFGLEYAAQWAELNIQDWNGLTISPGEAYQKVALHFKARVEK